MYGIEAENVVTYMIVYGTLCEMKLYIIHKWGISETLHNEKSKQQYF